MRVTKESDDIKERIGTKVPTAGYYRCSIRMRDANCNYLRDKEMDKNEKKNDGSRRNKMEIYRNQAYLRNKIVGKLGRFVLVSVVIFFGWWILRGRDHKVNTRWL